MLHTYSIFEIADTPSYTPSYVPNLDFSNMPQLQNLQHLITLAQSNPDLLNQLTSESLYGTPSQLTNVVASPAASLDSTSSSAPSLNQITNNIANVSDEANAINQDIEELGLSLQALAQYLGFDPA
jgi:methyl-accepting chemotaxis protein